MPTSAGTKLSIAAAGAALIALGTVSAAPANAITFKFGGKFHEGPQLEGSVTLDNNFLSSVLQQCLKGLEIVCDEPKFFDPSGAFSLNVGGNTISSSSGLSILPFVALNTPYAQISRGFITSLGDFDLAINPDRLGVCEDEGICSGLLAGRPGYAFFPVTTSDVKSVPEPDGAIALGMVSALMLMRKRKTSSSQRS